MRNGFGMNRMRTCAVCLVFAGGLLSRAQNPIQAAKDAYRKANQSQPQKPQPAGQPAQQGAQMNTAGLFTPPADVRVDSVPVAPFIQGVQFAVSRHGIHVAIPGPSGSRQVVVYDNVAGPKFDRLFAEGDGSSPIIFSPDGQRYAYCGAVGNEWVVMVDGKDLVRGPAGNAGAAGTANCRLGFTSNSRHIYFTSQRDISNSSSPSHFVFDGKAGPWGFLDGNAVFSPDGEHYAYMLSDGKQLTQLFVDGQPAPYNAGAPQWTATGHLYTTRASSGPNGAIVDVLVDGKPAMRTDGVALYMPPAGDMVVAKVTSGRVQFLVAGGRRVPGSDTPIGGLGDVVFSPDGKHYAVRMSGANQAYVFADGKRGIGYQHLDSIGVLVKNDPIAFSPDSSKVVYGAFTNNSNFVIYGGEESDPLPAVTEGAFSPVGGHFLSTGFGIVTLDGKILKLPNVSRNASQATGLGFSPDGTHYAFVVRNSGMFTMYLDGVPQSGYYWAGASTTTQKSKGTYVFSPDSKHIAYFCRSSNPAAGNDLYLCLDNSAVRMTGAVGGDNLAFTPDGNHLIWTVSRPQSGWRVMVDGKPVAEGFGRLSDETWQPGPDRNSWSFLLQDNDGLKRVTVTPSAGSSYTSMLGAR